MAKLKILKSGKTNIDSTDISDFAFHSDYPVYKVLQSGNAEFTMQGNVHIDDGDIDASYTVAHNLGYTPMVIGWLQNGTDIYPCNSLVETQKYFDLGGGSPYVFYGTSFVYCTADNTNITIGLHNILPADFPNQYTTTFKAHWRIMADEY